MIDQFLGCGAGLIELALMLIGEDCKLGVLSRDAIDRTVIEAGGGELALDRFDHRIITQGYGRRLRLVEIDHHAGQSLGGRLYWGKICSER